MVRGAINFLENDRRVRDRPATEIGGGTYNCCCPCRRAVVLAPGWHSQGQRDAERSTQIDMHAFQAETSMRQRSKADAKPKVQHC